MTFVYSVTYLYIFLSTKFFAHIQTLYKYNTTTFFFYYDFFPFSTVFWDSSMLIIYVPIIHSFPLLFVWIAQLTSILSTDWYLSCFQFFVIMTLWSFLFTSPGSHVQASLRLYPGVELLGYRACISATLLDNNYFLQQFTNLHTHQHWLKVPVASYLHQSFLPLLGVSIHQVLDAPTYIILLSNHRCDSVSILTMYLDLCPQFEVSAPYRIEPQPHLDVYQKAGLKMENNSVVFSIKCWLTNMREKSC